MIIDHYSILIVISLVVGRSWLDHLIFRVASAEVSSAACRCILGIGYELHQELTLFVSLFAMATSLVYRSRPAGPCSLFQVTSLPHRRYSGSLLLTDWAETAVSGSTSRLDAGLYANNDSSNQSLRLGFVLGLTPWPPATPTLRFE